MTQSQMERGEKKMRYTRDQLRARLAYCCVHKAQAELTANEQNEYKIAVNHFGANVMKNGLALALAFLGRQMEKRRANKMLLEHLAQVEVAGLDQNLLPEVFILEVVEMDVANYMLATRTYLRQIIWFRRAAHALILDQDGNDASGTALTPTGET
jgi:CRISPR type III-B/RAMP module-associated protein Cmr5